MIQILPNDLDQLIQMKTELLEQYSSLQKTGPEDKAIQTLRSIVNIHRKAFQVATANSEVRRSDCQAPQRLRDDGEYLSDELFRRNEFADSAKLRTEARHSFNDVLGEDHPSAKFDVLEVDCCRKTQYGTSNKAGGILRCDGRGTAGKTGDGQWAVRCCCSDFFSVGRCSGRGDWAKIIRKSQTPLMNTDRHCGCKRVTRKPRLSTSGA